MGLIQHYKIIRQLLFVHYNIIATSDVCSDAIKSADHKIQPYENANNFVKKRGLVRTDTRSATIGMGNIAAHNNSPLTNLDQEYCEKFLLNSA